MSSVLELSLCPPALDGEGDAQGHGGEEIPCVLLEDTAYVADRRNATTALTDTRSGARIQVTLCSARPPRVSYVCVYHHASSEAKEEVIGCEPKVISTDGDLVLLGIALHPLPYDLYIYRPAGDGGPSLTLLERPPYDRIDYNKIGMLSWHTLRHDDGDDSSGLSLLRAHPTRQDDTRYMVAALRYADFGQPEGVGHQLYVYDSEQPGSWRTHTVSLDEQKHGGYILHQTCKVIAIGGKHGTIGFVDLWRGIMLCDLLLVKDNPRLGYINLPPPLLPGGYIEGEDHGDARIYRDIAAVEDRIVYVEHDLHRVRCPTWYDPNHCLADGWVAATWSRLITSPVDAPWEKHHEIESSNMDISTPQFHLLPKVHDYEQGKTFPAFKRLSISQPTLSLCTSIVYFMVKKDIQDGKAWVIAVNMPNNKLEAVFEFDAQRSAYLGFVYMQSGISKYLKGSSGTKGNRKRPGETLLVGASNRKQPGILKLIEMLAGGSEEKKQDLEMEEGMAEDGDNDMLLDFMPSE